VDNEILIRFVTAQAKNCHAVLAVCTGVFILHRAGLLSGLRATTHWASLDRLRNLGDVTVVEERIVRDGPIWTSAGVSAGIDLALAFIADAAGEETAGRIQFGVEYYPANRYYGPLPKHDKTPQYIRREIS
jgi:transcriptional regulator GlxA family with amidase domain